MANKWTDGWLCRDRGGTFQTPYEDFIFFFGDAIYEAGGWYTPSQAWPISEYCKTYDLAPPAKGKRFDVSIQL